MDLVASRQLFAFHLPEMCVKGSASAALFEAMSEDSRARGGLLSVLGYFPRQEARLRNLLILPLIPSHIPSTCDIACAGLNSQTIGNT